MATWLVVHNFKRLFWWSEKGKLPHYVYIGRSLRACLLGLLYSHTLILSRSKQDRGSNTVFLPSKNTSFLSSPLVTDPDVSPSAGEGEEGQRLGCRRQQGRRPTASRTVISGRAPVREVLRSLRRCLWADPASRRPPIHIPTTFRYIFVRNRLSSTSPARYVAACASFSTSQPLLIGWSNVAFFSIVRGKATSWSRILYSLRLKILVIEMDVSGCILVLETSILIFRTEGVLGSNKK